MIVNRGPNPTTPPTMTLYFRDRSIEIPPNTVETPVLSATHGHNKAPAPKAWEKAITIDMTNVHSDKILQDFMIKSGAVPVRPTEQEEMEMREVASARQDDLANLRVGAPHLVVVGRAEDEHMAMSFVEHVPVD